MSLVKCKLLLRPHVEPVHFITGVIGWWINWAFHSLIANSLDSFSCILAWHIHNNRIQKVFQQFYIDIFIHILHIKTILVQKPSLPWKMIWIIVCVSGSIAGGIKAFQTVLKIKYKTQKDNRFWCIASIN